MKSESPKRKKVPPSHKDRSFFYIACTILDTLTWETAFHIGAKKGRLTQAAVSSKNVPWLAPEPDWVEHETFMNSPRRF
jgi:hypothetical protein